MSEPIELNNEFARIRLEVDNQGNGPRLKITSVLLGREIYLDPIQLESLTWQNNELFSTLLKTPFGPE
jgi:hypothetical protein